MPEEYTNTLPVGTELDTYRVERVLGEGGFGITYLARELNLGKLYAIKELLPDGIAVRQADEATVKAKSSGSAEDFAATRKYFISEARILAGMDHPAVVKVHRLMEANGTCYMVMDYVEGDTLGDYLKKQGGTLSGADEFQQIFYPLMEGLEVLHGQGIIHRDIKPGNIMVKPDGSPVLLDFGAATQTQSKTMTITQMLSAGYSPFEQYTSRAKQGPYTDIYALGATMHKAITGKKPDDASDRMYGDTCEALAQNPAYLEAYGRELLGAVDVALRMDPEQRPQTVDAWRRMFEGGPNEASAPQQGALAHDGGVPMDIPPVDAAEASQEPGGIKQKGRKEVWVGSLVAGLMLLAFVVIMMAVLQDEPGVEKQEEAGQQVAQQGGQEAQQALGKLADVDQQKKKEEDLVLAEITSLLYQPEARQLAQDFAKSGDPTARLKMSRNPQQTSRRMADYSAEALELRATEVEFMDVVDLGGIMAARSVAKFDNGLSRLICVVPTLNGLRVDWDCYARYNSKAWPKLIDGSIKSAELRVFAKRSDYYNFDYRDDSKWISFEFVIPDSDQPLYAYAARGTTTAKLLEAALPVAGSNKSLQLTVGVSIGGGDHKWKQFTIDRLHAFGWVRPEQDIEHSYRSTIHELTD